MQLSNDGLGLIKTSEGFRNREYLDPAGLATIGYGHKVTPSESFPGEITEEQATALLMRDVRTAEQAVSRLVRVSLSQGQFDALVDFCFNMGAGKLAGSTLLRELNASRYAAAGLELLRWDYATGAPDAGLRTRRTAELHLFAGTSTSPVHPGNPPVAHPEAGPETAEIPS